VHTNIAAGEKPKDGHVTLGLGDSWKVLGAFIDFQVPPASGSGDLTYILGGNNSDVTVGVLLRIALLVADTVVVRTFATLPQYHRAKA
jgi:hypothetical protein